MILDERGHPLDVELVELGLHLRSCTACRRRLSRVMYRSADGPAQGCSFCQGQTQEIRDALGDVVRTAFAHDPGCPSLPREIET